MTTLEDVNKLKKLASSMKTSCDVCSHHQCGYCKSLVQYHFREIVNLANEFCDDYLAGKLPKKLSASDYAVRFFGSDEQKIITVWSIKGLVYAVAEFKKISNTLLDKLLNSLEDDDIDCIRLYNQFVSTPSDSICSVWKIDSQVFVEEDSR